MDSFVNCYKPEDWVEIEDGVAAVRHATTYYRNHKCRIEIPVEQRYWEYGSAVHLLLREVKVSEHTRVLNVGAGWDALGPTLAGMCGVHVTEWEPDVSYRQDRERINMILTQDGKNPILLENKGIQSSAEETYDAVFCISVLEHVEEEQQAWLSLGRKVEDGGLLFVTVDCVEDQNKAYTSDNVRVTKYTPELLMARVGMMMEAGFTPIGKPESRWTGAYVYDYNFFRAGFIKTGKRGKNENLSSNNLARSVWGRGVRTKSGKELTPA